MQALVNDRWWAAFTVDRVGTWEYTVVAWVDRFLTWQMAQTSGLAGRFKDFAAQCLAEYDLEGWTAPDLIAPTDVRLFGTKPRPRD